MPRGRGRGRGPIGGLIGLAGQGVGMAQEHREHRRDQREARSASQQDINATSQDSTTLFQQPARTPEEAPPAYADVAAESETTLQSSQPATSDTKGEPERWEDDSSDSDIENVSLEDDSEDWELDDFDDPLTPSTNDTQSLPSYEESEAMKEGETVDDLVREVMADSTPRPPPPSQASSDEMKLERVPLPCPVVIPQRRPRKKARGFVRAYAPVLEDCGIDEKTFLRFLKNFHKSSQASPIFPAIQVAAGIAGFAPSVIAMAVTTVAQVAAGVGAEMQTRSRTNNFLDRMNDELFNPNGLYAMIIKYKSDAEMQAAAGSQGPLTSLVSMIRPEQVDVSTNQSIAKYARTISHDSGERSMNERMQNLRLASGTTRGTIELPEAAPLIFPDIDHKLSHEGPETFKDKTKDAKKFLADYLDRRAQMQYALQDPNSSLATQQQQSRPFKSSFSNPNHPMYSGGLVTLVSGGKLNRHEARLERRRDRALAKDMRRVERGKSPRREYKRARRYGEDYAGDLDARIAERRERLGMMIGRGRGRGRGFGHGFERRGFGGGELGEGSSRWERRESYRSGKGRAGRGGRRGGPIGAVRRVMREDVLYLMIVNMPSEAELEEARQELARAKGRT